MIIPCDINWVIMSEVNKLNDCLVEILEFEDGFGRIKHIPIKIIDEKL